MYKFIFHYIYFCGVDLIIQFNPFGVYVWLLLLPKSFTRSIISSISCSCSLCPTLNLCRLFLCTHSLMECSLSRNDLIAFILVCKSCSDIPTITCTSLVTAFGSFLLRSFAFFDSSHNCFFEINLHTGSSSLVT